MNMIKTEVSMQPKTLDEAMNLSQRISKSEIVPKIYRNKPDDILVAIMLGAECGLSAIQSLQNIAVINGKPSIYGDAMLALVQNHAAFESITETFDDGTMTATCTVKRKGSEPHVTTFSQSDAERAGLWQTEEMVERKKYQSQDTYKTKNDSPWWKYPKRMLQMRARGFALRDQFSDALLGLISREEAEDYISTITDITKESYVVTDENVTAKQTTAELVALPIMSDERFNSNLTQYESVINSGKKTNADVIYTLRGKYDLTDKQVQIIEAIKL